MAERPPITWGWLKQWARDNQITDDHVVADEEGRVFRDMREGESASGTGQPALILQRRWG